MGIDPDRMRAVVAVHGGCEVARDWDGALATMVAEPFYVFHPFGLHISGDAIVEMWSRFFTPTGAIYPFSGQGTVPGTHTMRELVGPTSLVHISSSVLVVPGGADRQKDQLVEYTFENGLLLSETFWAGHALVPFLDEVFDESFRALPGVVQA